MTLDGQTTSADFHYQPGVLLPYGTFSIARNEDTVQGEADVRYTTPFVDSSVTDSVSPSTNNLMVSAGMALVTAGGAFGITGPISDSFALIVPRDNMIGQTIFAKGTSDGYDGVVTDKINVGLSQLSSYTWRTVTLSSPTAPVDSSMGPTIRVLSPTYKSGTVISVGTKSTVFISGKLTLHGKPLAYRTGELSSPDHSESFFTDENGAFQVYNLTPGSWTLTIDETDLRQTLTIPAATTKQYDVGAIEVGQ